MIKKIEWKHLIKTIQKNLVSFLAVAFIAAVSIALYLGMQSGTIAILQHANDYYISNKLSTFELVCANGITKEDIAAIKAWESVDHAEGGYAQIVTTMMEKEKLTLQALSLCDEVNETVVLEGSLPTSADEVAVEQKFAEQKGLALGDTLVLEHDGSLLEDTFRVTAVINQPAYGCAIGLETRGVSTEGLGYAAYYIGLAKEAFDEAYYGGTFTKAYIRNDALDEVYFFSDAYKEEEKALKTKFEPWAQQRAQLRYEELLEQAQPAIDAGMMDAEDIQLREWMLLGREECGDLRSVRGLVDSVNGISYSLSIIFLFVATVVCYTAITRMIDEQRALLGTQKAMGFLPEEILKHYMLYNLLCAVIGIVLGVLIGVVVVENIVLIILADKFLLGSFVPIVAWKECLIAVCICLAIFLVTTYISCAKLVRESAIELLRGEVPAKGKHHFFENWKVYKNMRLYSKTMIKNVLNDKTRMVTTVIGVMGSIALLIICLSLKMSIDGAFAKQFDEYFLYENRLVIDSSEGLADNFIDVLDEETVPYLNIQDKVRAFRVDGGAWMNAHLVVADDAKMLKEYMVLRDTETGEVLELPSDGFLVSRKCAEIYGLSEGSLVEINDAGGVVRTAKVAGIVDHFLQYHMFVTSEAYYEEVMQEDADKSVFLLKGEIDGLQEKVVDIAGYMSLKDNSELAEDVDAIYMAIGVCLALSVALSFLVLLNQIAMHINRKTRELAVMRINGYTIGQTKAYIYKDNIVLTALGLVFGCVVGIIASYIVILIMEREPSSYIHTPSLLACVYACLVEIVFAVIVNVIALRKIEKLSLTNVGS